MKIKQLVAILAMSPVAASIAASDTGTLPVNANVDISEVVSTGTSAAYTEAEGNLWFLLDDSGSMGKKYSIGIKWIKQTDYYGNWNGLYSVKLSDIDHGGEYDKDYDGLVVENWSGYIDYDPSVTYKLPNRIDGTRFELPKDQNQFYPWAFRDDALNEYKKANGGGSRPLSVLNIRDKKDPRKLLNAFYCNWDGYECEYLYLPTMCYKQKDIDNCRTWMSFYMTRMDVLQSSLSLSLDDEKSADKLKRLRLGYNSLHNRIAKIGYKPGYSPGTPIAKNRILPVAPFYGTEAVASKKALKQWLYSLSANGYTPARGLLTEMLKDIFIASDSKKTSANNPFLVKPGEAPNSTSNQALACRRNYMMIMSDGGWNRTKSSEVYSNLKTAAIAQSNSTGKMLWTRKNYTIPAGGKDYSYNIMPPYNYNYSRTTPTLTDIAFTTWWKDMDNDDTNDDLEMLPRVTDGVTRPKHPNVPSGATQDAEFWHPHNDPANWQHMNFYTMGFGLKYSPVGVNESGKAFNTNYLTGKPFTLKTKNNSEIYENYAAQDLAGAALAGRGRFYPVNSAQEMIKAFGDLLASTGGGGAEPGVKGSAGAMGNARSVGSSHYASRYSQERFSGELIKRKIFDGDLTKKAACFGSAVADADAKYGKICTKQVWNAAKVVSGMTPASRKIFSMVRQSDGKDLTPRDITNLDVSKPLTYKDIDFKSDKLSQLLKNRLINKFPDSVKALAARNNLRLAGLIAYLRGDGSNEGDNKLRVRNDYTYHDVDNDGKEVTVKDRNVLGMIMRSSPLYVDLPLIGKRHQFRRSDSYLKFLRRYIWIWNDTDKKYESPCKTDSALCGNKSPIGSDYVNLLFVGADDGMLHAFRADTGSELFAYVPNAVYDKLPLLADQKSVSDPNINVTTVDGNIVVETIDYHSDVGNITADNAVWKRMLVAGMGDGAKGLFAFEVTNPGIDNTTEAVIGDEFGPRWEYSDLESKLYQKGQLDSSASDYADKVKNLKSNVGNIIASPSVIQLNDGTWAAITGNGYNSESNKAALLVIDAVTGKTIQELVLESTDHTDDTLANGLGPVYFMTYGHKPSDKASRADRAYAGDLQGNLWVFDLTAAGKDGGIKVAGDKGSGYKPLFTAKRKRTNDKGEALDASGNVVADKNKAAEIRQPITVRPLVKRHPKKYGYIVHFGTGALFNEKDLSSGIRNSIYAIWDDWVPKENGGLPVDSRAGKNVKLSQLQEVKFKKLEGEEQTFKKPKKNADGTTTMIDVKATVRQLAKSEGGVNSKIEWAYTDDINSGKRGWHVDLLTGERAWQDPFLSYGNNNVEAVAYNTVIYDDGNATTTDADPCKTASTNVRSWQMAFNASDGTQHVTDNGVLDVNSDGKVNKNDLVLNEGQTTPNTLSGLQDVGKVVFGGKPSVVSRPHNEKLTDRTCKYISQVIEDSDNGAEARLTCIRSHNSSWRQLGE